MKKLLVLFVSVLSASAFGMTEKAQKEITEMIVTGDYQKLRNVAYGMEKGAFGHDENPITACAIRKVIILLYPDKSDDTDYANESISCQKVAPTQNKKAWETASTLVTAIQAKK